MLMLTPEPASCRGASRHLGLLSCPAARAIASSVSLECWHDRSELTS